MTNALSTTSTWRGKGTRRRLLAAASSLALAVGTVAFDATPAHASPSPAAVGAVVALGGGFDACTAPSTSMLNAWWNPGPYWWVGIYIGGDERACSQPNLTASWVAQNSATGWGFEPLWVGPQMSSSNGCSSTYYTYAIPTGRSAAYNLGKSEAGGAVSAAASLGFAPGGVLYYDLEAFTTTDPTCLQGAEAFIDGWDVQLKNDGWHGGMYGSSCGSSLTSFASIPRPPVEINGADWDGNPNTNVMSCVPSSQWANGHRLKQYLGGHNETWGGYTDNIDSDCAYGAVEDATVPNDPGDGCN